MATLGTGYKMSLDDFEIVRWIGIGGFSTVIEVKKKDNGKTYAMKIIQKWMIEKKAKIKQIMAERNILKMVDNPFIIKLHWAFKSVRNYLNLMYWSNILERLPAYGSWLLFRRRVFLSFE